MKSLAGTAGLKSIAPPPLPRTHIPSATRPENSSATDTTNHTATTTTTTSTDVARTTQTSPTLGTEITTTMADLSTPPCAELSPQAATVRATNTEGAARLTQAIATGNLAAVKTLLASGPFLVNHPLDDGLYALQLAAREGQLEIVDLLLAQHGIQPDLADANGMTALHEAARAGHVHIVTALLSKGARCNAFEHERNARPLHLALIGKQEKVVRLLLERQDVDIHAPLKSGATPFFLAIDAGLLEMAQRLKALGVDIDTKTTDGWRPILVACQNGTPELLSWLLQQKPALFLQGPHKLNLLHAAAMNAAHPQNIERLRQHLPNDFHKLLVQPDEWDNPPVHYAIVHNQTEDVIDILQPTPPQAAVQQIVPTHYNHGRLIFGNRDDSMGSSELTEIGKNAGILMDVYSVSQSALTWRGLTRLRVTSGEFLICHFDAHWNERLQQVMVRMGETEAVPLLNVALVLFNKGVLRVLFLGKEVFRCAEALKRLFIYDQSLHRPPEPGDILSHLKFSFAGGEGPSLTLLNNETAALSLRDCAQGKKTREVGNQLFLQSALPLTTLSGDEYRREFVLTVQKTMPTHALYGMNEADAATAKVALLFRHVHQNDADKVRELLTEHGVNPDVKCMHKTALHVACEVGSAVAAEVLLAHGADFMTPGPNGKLAMEIACTSGHANVVQLLLNRQASVDQPQGEGRIPLHFASEKGHTKTVQLLLRHGASVNVVKLNGQSALEQASRAGHLDVVRTLLDHGAVVDLLDAEGCSALHAACTQGHLAVVHLLLTRGASLHIGNKDGMTPLHFAAREDHFEVAKLLLEKGAEVGALSAKGQTPLFFVVEKNHLVAVELLLQHKADASQTLDKQSYFILDLAIEKNHVNVVDLLLQHGANAARADQNGNTPLIVASRLGDAAMVKLLKPYGLVNHKNNASETALHAACRVGNVPVVRELLNMGADIDIKNELGKTAGDLAKHREHQEVLDLLRPKAPKRKWFKI